MIKLSFFGGVNEIGGNKILLEADGTKIFLDFGMSFNKHTSYWAEYMTPRKLNGINDFIEFGMLPKIDGIYRKDYLQHTGMKYEDTPAVDGVLLSHGHMDHVGYVHFLRDDIPIFCSEATKMIMKAIQDVGAGTFNDLVQIATSFQFKPKKDGKGHSRVYGEESYKDRPVNTFTFGKRFKIGNLEIEPVHIDHSLPGATAFIIHTSEGAVVYTGDIRFHGRRAELSEKFIESARNAEPEILITEGTRIMEKDWETEEDVERKAGEVVKKTKELAIVNFPGRDTDRLITFLNVAKATGRKLAIESRIAYLLELLKGTDSIHVPSVDDDSIRIYMMRKGWGLIDRVDFPDEIRKGDYEKWEQKYMGHDNLVTWKDVRDSQKDFIFYCNFFQLKELIDVRPKEGSNYIRSLVEPFSEDMELDEKRVNNWMKHFGLYPMHQIHASGHAPGTEIKRMIAEMKPKKVIPVHTQHPKEFKKIVGKETKVEFAKLNV